MPNETGRREEDREGYGLSMRLAQLEKKVDAQKADIEECDKRNRKDIHDLKNGNQTVIDQLHKLSLDMAPYVGSVNLLREMRDDIKSLDSRSTRNETALAVNTAVTKAGSKTLKLWISIAAVVISSVVLFSSKGCGQAIKAAWNTAETVSQTQTAVDH